jgi:hypothetical protein
MIGFDADKLFAFEAGELDEEETIALFQQLIDSGASTDDRTDGIGGS